MRDAKRRGRRRELAAVLVVGLLAGPGAVGQASAAPHVAHGAKAMAKTSAPVAPLVARSVVLARDPSGRVSGSLLVANTSSKSTKAVQGAVAWRLGATGQVVQLGRFSIPALGAKRTSKKLKVSVSIPKGAKPGTYALLACVDVTGQLVRFSTARCVRGGKLTVSAPSGQGGSGGILVGNGGAGGGGVVGSGGGSGFGGVTGGGSAGGTPGDTQPPETAITAGPAGLRAATSESVAFSSSEAGSSFACRLDGGAWAPCTSPASLTGLADGPHVFEVRATDAAANADPSPAAASWTVDVTPPATTITSAPTGVVLTATADIGFTSEPGAHFECRLDAAAFAPCSSPWHLAGLADGLHTAEVRAIDAAGNADATPAVASWTVSTSGS